MTVDMSIKAKISMKKKEDSRGFTIFELIVTMVIMATVAAISIPSYLTYIPKARISGAARMVMADLMAARMTAVKKNTRTKIFFDGYYQYKICTDADGNGIVNDGEGEVVTKDIRSEYPGVKLIHGPNPIFLPRGTITSDGSYTYNYVYTYNGTSWKRIGINISGKIAIEYYYSYDA